MKIITTICAVLCTIFLGSLLWIALEQRAEQKAAQAAAQKQAQVEMIREAIQSRHDQLVQIYDDWNRQYKLLHEDAEQLGITNEAAKIWDEYTASSLEAYKQLQATQLDLTVPLPSTKYIDDELRIGLLMKH